MYYTQMTCTLFQYLCIEMYIYIYLAGGNWVIFKKDHDDGKAFLRCNNRQTAILVTNRRKSITDSLIQLTIRLGISEKAL